jgi:seryl-tRNA synthetase
MHDIAFIRANPEAFDGALKKRGLPAHSADILAIDSDRRACIVETEQAQARRNEASKLIGEMKRTGGNADALMAEVADLKERLPALQEKEKALQQQLDEILSALPNLPNDDVPLGEDETGNAQIRQIGSPKNYEFTPKEHFALGEAWGTMDFEAAAKLSGSRFVVLRGQLARLERALGNFMLDIHTGEFGYSETTVPLLVRDDAMYGTGQLPKFKEDLFQTTDGRWLIPTAEVSLTNLVADSILEEEALPIRLTAWSQCFRSEAGSAGRDTRGMIRQHQFPKVELVSITHPEKSDEEHERMTEAAETVLKRLGLTYRTMLLCTGDMGFSSRKTYDIEVWLPGQGAYREISSCSNCGDFQARRMKARFRPQGEKQTRFVHTLNGSGMAIGRAMVAILENYQQEDGSVVVPEALQPYMGGLTVIGR